MVRCQGGAAWWASHASLRGLGLLLALVVVGACGDRRPESDRPADPVAGVADTATPDAEPDLHEIEPGVSVTIRRLGEWRYLLTGHIDRVPALELTVEDGHNILFGPEHLPVTDGRFRMEFVMDSTDLPQAIALLHGTDGRRLAVIRIDFDREVIVAGEPIDTTSAEAGPP